MTPAAANVCPMLLLMAETGIFSAFFPKTSSIDLAYISSPAYVEVAWTFRWSTSSGLTFAISSASLIARTWPCPDDYGLTRW